jgi:hypothetical protein
VGGMQVVPPQLVVFPVCRRWGWDIGGQRGGGGMISIQPELDRSNNIKQRRTETESAHPQSQSLDAHATPCHAIHRLTFPIHASPKPTAPRKETIKSGSEHPAGLGWTPSPSRVTRGHSDNEGHYLNSAALCFSGPFGQRFFESFFWPALFIKIRVERDFDT